MDFFLFLLFHTISTGRVLLPIRIQIGLEQKGDFYKAKIKAINCQRIQRLRGLKSKVQGKGCIMSPAELTDIFKRLIKMKIS